MKGKISLNRRQITFVTEILEIEDPEIAVERMAQIMIEERVDAEKMAEFIDKILKRMGK